MFGLFNQTPRCPVDNRKMVNVHHNTVPPAALREFARMNRYQPLLQYGWYYCPEHEIHIHKQALETANRPYRR